MKTIWKFTLTGHPGTLISLDMPAGAKILDCQPQLGVPTIWAIVDPAHGLVKRRFFVFGTGWNMEDFDGKLVHIRTFQDGVFVWHVFEVTP